MSHPLLHRYSFQSKLHDSMPGHDIPSTHLATHCTPGPAQMFWEIITPGRSYWSIPIPHIQKTTPRSQSNGRFCCVTFAVHVQWNPAFKHLELLQSSVPLAHHSLRFTLMQWFSTLLSHSSMKDPPCGGVKNLKLGDRLVPPTIFPATLWQSKKHTPYIRQNPRNQPKA